MHWLWPPTAWCGPPRACIWPSRAWLGSPQAWLGPPWAWLRLSWAQLQPPTALPGPPKALTGPPRAWLGPSWAWFGPPLAWLCLWGEQTDERMDGICPHSTGLCPLSEPLPKKALESGDHRRSEENLMIYLELVEPRSVLTISTYLCQCNTLSIQAEGRYTIPVLGCVNVFSKSTN